jgi:hypothetical protein
MMQSMAEVWIVPGRNLNLVSKPALRPELRDANILVHA